MYQNKEKIILASGSPRRRQYLEDAGLNFEVFAKEIDEKPLSGESPQDFVIRMALEKARAVGRNFPDAWVLSGDTEVCLDQKILGKPVDDEAAVRMIMDLSGREHVVRTGFCVVHCLRHIEVVRSVATTVQFANLSEITARAYVATGESLDKAGGYAIQGKGACLVESIKGSYSNVVGLPLFEILQILLECGAVWPVGSAKSSQAG